MIKILNLEPENYSEEALALLKEFAQIDNGTVEPSQLKNVLNGYDIVITRLGYKFDKDTLNAAPNLKAIVTATTGLNHIDVSVAEKNGQSVLSLKGETAFLETITATAELTFALILSLARKLPSAINHTQAGLWDRNIFKGVELRNKTLGIYGYGRLGKIVAQYGAIFGMDVITYDISPILHEPFSKITQVTKDEILQRSDFLSLHAAYNEGNRHIINEKSFRSMKKSAFFINTARGELVDELALVNALKEGQIAAAAVDVIQEENVKSPAISQSPLIQYMQKQSNLIITPHIGGATFDSMRNTEIFMAKKLKNWVKDQDIF